WQLKLRPDETVYRNSVYNIELIKYTLKKLTLYHGFKEQLYRFGFSNGFQKADKKINTQGKIGGQMPKFFEFPCTQYEDEDNKKLCNVNGYHNIYIWCGFKIHVQIHVLDSTSKCRHHDDEYSRY